MHLSLKDCETATVNDITRHLNVIEEVRRNAKTASSKVDERINGALIYLRARIHPHNIIVVTRL